MARPRIAELVESGELREVQVEGWRDVEYIHRDTALPRRNLKGAALLSPFDPLIWFRPRLERLFQFEYRFEAFTRSEHRKWGVCALLSSMATVWSPGWT